MRSERYATAIMFGAIVAAGIAGAALGYSVPARPTFNLEATSATEDVFILDHGLTSDDCRDAMGDYPRELRLSCVPTFNQK